MDDGRITLRGMVLSERPVGEYDKLVTLLTLERGKVRAFARGAKRPRNRLAAAMQPFHFGNFRVFEGRNSITVEDAEILHYFEGVRDNLDNSLTGMLFLELADYYAQENDVNRELLALLYQSLRALENGKPDRQLVQVVFEIRSLVIDGQFPGLPEGEWQESTCYAVRYIVETPIEKLYTFTVSAGVLSELARIAALYRRQFIDRDLNSLAFL
ncbi:MAG: DNA repair protein RecO [Lachnospiraceae bacterium]|nr:DNA repair protein RecO [Lachnospiraceae bacterium]